MKEISPERQDNVTDNVDYKMVVNASFYRPSPSASNLLYLFVCKQATSQYTLYPDTSYTVELGVQCTILEYMLFSC